MKRRRLKLASGRFVGVADRDTLLDAAAQLPGVEIRLPQGLNDPSDAASPRSGNAALIDTRMLRGTRLTVYGAGAVGESANRRR